MCVCVCVCVCAHLCVGVVEFLSVRLFVCLYFFVFLCLLALFYLVYQCACLFEDMISLSDHVTFTISVNNSVSFPLSH